MGLAEYACWHRRRRAASRPGAPQQGVQLMRAAHRDPLCREGIGLGHVDRDGWVFARSLDGGAVVVPCTTDLTGRSCINT